MTRSEGEINTDNHHGENRGRRSYGELMIQEQCMNIPDFHSKQVVFQTLYNP